MRHMLTRCVAGIHKGNYWISDQIAGLQWVQEHAADFGGDPSQVSHRLRMRLRYRAMSDTLSR